jgi:hypothetical protein
MKRLSKILLALVPLPVLFAAPAAAATAPQSCETLSKPTVQGAVVLSVSGVVKPGGTVPHPGYPGYPTPPPVTNVPPFCDVTVLLTHPGVNDRVKVRLWAPVNGWTGRFLGVGGGGYAMDQGEPGLAEAIKLGYAAASTDGGLDGNGLDPGGWALKPDGKVNTELLTNFGSRSLHDMTVAAKAATAQYYGRPADFAYWYGCSTGGRQGMMNAQRYPLDYDGITANAPAIHMDRFVVAEMWPQVVMNQSQNFPTVCELNAFSTAAVDACDRIDGVTDRVINDPSKCRFNPYSVVGTKVVCDGKEITISRADADVVRKIWDGPGNWYGLNKGADMSAIAGPSPFPIAENWVKYFLKQDPAFDTTTMTYGDYYKLFAESHQRYDSFVGTDDPDLSAFRNAGGKLVTWHGTDDEVIFYQATVAYHDRVARRTSNVDDFYRLFLAPGVGHCFGGPGPIPTDPLAAVIAWVEQNKAPDTLPAKTLDGTATRNLCPYPQISRYNGHGDPKLPTSHTCRR